MRGEHWVRVSTGQKIMGSSPHARGALLASLELTNGKGIIPACAGSTCILLLLRCVRWDHPRMRGEHHLLRGQGYAPRGSSPHARGAQ